MTSPSISTVSSSAGRVVLAYCMSRTALVFEGGQDRVQGQTSAGSTSLLQRSRVLAQKSGSGSLCVKCGVKDNKQF